MEAIVGGCGVVKAPRPQDQFPVRVEISRPNDGGIAPEVLHNVLSLQFRECV